MRVFLLLLPLAASLRLFSPSQFTIRRQVGQLGFATETEWQYYAPRNPLDPSQPTRTVEASGISVRLFEAALDGGDRVLLKQFLKPAVPIGQRELALHKQLAPLPPPSPLASLLGSLTTDALFETPAFARQWSNALPDTPPPSAGELWLIFKWEGLATIANFASAPQERIWWDLKGTATATARKRFLKVLTGRSLQALSWLHAKGVAHRSIGPSSLIMSTYDQQLPTRLFVKLIDLGFGTTASLLPPEEISAAMSRGATTPLDVLPLLQRDDLHCLAYVLLETMLAAAGAEGEQPPPSTELQGLKRLVEDVFEGDVTTQFRAYVREEQRWGLACELLDEHEMAGWQLLQQMVDCREPASEAARRVSAQGLLESAWFND